MIKSYFLKKKSLKSAVLSHIFYWETEDGYGIILALLPESNFQKNTTLAWQVSLKTIF